MPASASPATQWAVPGVSDHPLREVLTNEIHAREPLALAAPLKVSHLALLSGEDGRAADRAHVAALCRRFGAAEPGPEDTMWAVDCGPFLLSWERHTEFSGFTFIRQQAFDEPFRHPVIEAVPKDWLGTLTGPVLVAVHLALEPASAAPRRAELLNAQFASNNIAASAVAGGAATVWTDFRLQGDGFIRLLVRDAGLSGRQAGRVVQRLLEIETYRIMALLGFPLARGFSREVTRTDEELAAITQEMSEGPGEADQHGLLERLTALAAQIERIAAATNYRFGASRAYDTLVHRRLEELREERVDGYPTLGEFLNRRLAPAMHTCESLRDRLEVLSKRVSRAANLLRTRVDLILERQNQDLLRSMDRRADLQVRLQQTVEGLSVVVLSYYLVGLTGYAFKGLKSLGVAVNPDLATGLALPVVVGLVWWGTHRLRHRVTRR